MDDSTRWDIIHQKNLRHDEPPSDYAVFKEKLFPRAALVVELGAGTGADCLYFLEKGHRVIALDISDFALKILQEKVEKENLAKGLATKKIDFGLHSLPIKENSIDVVYSRISLNYFGSKHTTKILMDIYKILKPGGKCYLTFKSPEDKAEIDYLQKKSSVYEPNVYIEGGMLRSRFNADQLKAMLTNAGISSFEVTPHQENLKVKGEGHNPILFVNEVSFTK